MWTPQFWSESDRPAWALPHLRQPVRERDLPRPPRRPHATQGVIQRLLCSLVEQVTIGQRGRSHRRRFRVSGIEAWVIRAKAMLMVVGGDDAPERQVMAGEAQVRGRGGVGNRTGAGAGGAGQSRAKQWRGGAVGRRGCGGWR